MSSSQSEHIIAYRPPQKRREESICDVNASFRIEFESNNNKEVVRSAHLVFGGCGSMIKKARKTEETITGESWDNSLLEKALESIPLDLASSPDGATGGNARYQETLSKSYFYKFYITVLGRTTNVSCAEQLSVACGYYIFPCRSGLQIYVNTQMILDISYNTYA